MVNTAVSAATTNTVVVSVTKTPCSFQRKKNKYMRPPNNYPEPLTDRNLPESLGFCHETLKVGDVLARTIATQAAKEFLGLDGCHTLENYQITSTVKAHIRPGAIHKRLRSCDKFCKSYEAMVQDVIAPHIVEKFAAEKRGALTERDRTVLYQFPPTIRIYCSHLRKSKKVSENIGADSLQYRSLGRFHCDAVYGHQVGEINFWMPLTAVDESSTLWAETYPGKADFYPFMVPLGCVQRFPGTYCRHFTKPNVSGKTRVSIDFRCSTLSCFDRTWALPGMKHRHDMREIIVSDKSRRTVGEDSVDL